jgi:hypothetical protein
MLTSEKKMVNDEWVKGFKWTTKNIYNIFHATLSNIFMSHGFTFCDMVKYSLLMCKIFCHMDKGPTWKYKLFSCTRTHFGFCDLLYDYVLIKKDIFD